MKEVTWPIPSFHHVSLSEFISFWDQLYSGYDEAFYQENIGQPLTEERIQKWFAWKNGRSLSKKKIQAVSRYGAPEERIDANADSEALFAFLNRPGGTIWRIFWLHLQHPSQFPIYDQHVHRAMAALCEWPKLEISAVNKTKVRTYLEDYRPFFARFQDHNPRQVDRALWSFGRFLASAYGKLLACRPSEE